MEETSLPPLAIPRLNACQEFGRFAARLHATRFTGGLDITNCKFEPDGTFKAMFSTGRGQVQEEPLTPQQRASDLAAVKKQLGGRDEWEAFKAGYQFGAPNEAAEVFGQVEP